jgi:hypothetical protein
LADQANIKATDKRAIKWVKMEWLVQLERAVANFRRDMALKGYQIPKHF